ncbi:hypothetical protein HF998_00960 [Cellulomonas hominis]|nr:hypothetical protein [Cellulomonas hominis]
MSSTPTLSPGGLALAAAEHVTAHPGTSTADLIGALAPYTEVPHVRVLEVVHRHSRSLGFGQGSDLRWYAAPDSAEIAAAVRADAPGPMVQPYLDACRELEAVVSVGRSTRVLNALGQALLADAGVDLDRCGLQHEPILADQRQRNLGVAGQAGAGSVAR